MVLSGEITVWLTAIDCLWAALIKNDFFESQIFFWFFLHAPRDNTGIELYCSSSNIFAHGSKPTSVIKWCSWIQDHAENVCHLYVYWHLHQKNKIINHCCFKTTKTIYFMYIQPTPDGSSRPKGDRGPKGDPVSIYYIHWHSHAGISCVSSAIFWTIYPNS